MIFCYTVYTKSEKSKLERNYFLLMSYYTWIIFSDTF